MEGLFKTSIDVDDESIVYQVFFYEEKYVFSAGEEAKDLASFSFVRTHDEWQEQQSIPIEVKMQAIDALDKFLMKQH